MGQRRGKGEGTIYQRSDGLWTAQVTLGTSDGKQVRKTVYSRTKKGVLEKLKALQVKHSLGQLSTTRQYTVETWTDLWLQEVKNSVSETSYICYRTAAEGHIYPFLGPKKLDSLTPEVILRFYRTLEEEGRTKDQQNRAGRILRRVLGLAVRRRLIPHNVAQEVSVPKVLRSPVRPMTVADLTRFLEAARSDRLYALYLLAIDSGLRIGELLALEWSDLDFRAGQVSVTKTVKELSNGKVILKDTKTRASRRVVALTQTTLEALQVHRAKMSRWKNQTVVFPTTWGNRWRPRVFRRYAFYPLLARIGIPRFRFHTLRHTCASLLLSQNLNPRFIQERLGHSNIQTTLGVYSHVLPGFQSLTVGVMSGILDQAVPQQYQRIPLPVLPGQDRSEVQPDQGNTSFHVVTGGPKNSSLT